MLGQVAAVMMYGVLLSEFNAYCHSPGWRRSSRAMQSAVVAVMLTVTGASPFTDTWFGLVRGN